MTNKEIWLYLRCRNNSNKDNSGDSGESGGSDIDTPTDPPIPTTEFNYSITNNEVTITGLKDKSVSGEVVIPSKIEGYDVTSIGDNAFQNCTNLTSITMPNSVTIIGIYAFAGCSGLTSIEIPNSVNIINGFAFSGCVNVSSVIIPDSVTNIEDRAFQACYALTSIEIPSSVTTIGIYTLQYCYKLTNATLGDDFNCNNLNLSVSTNYSVDTLVGMLNALADRTGETAYTLRLGTTNLAKLTDEDIAIATNKNWTLA